MRNISKALISLCLVVANLPASISVKFQGTGTAMASTETAGVVALAHWNNAPNASSANALRLFDDKGVNTGATITWSSDNGWLVPITDTPGNNRMMRGYLDDSSGRTTSITVNGLAAGTYTVYVYADGDNASSTRSGTYTLTSGATITSRTITDPANTNFSGAFTSGTNYAAFPLTLAASGGFTLTSTQGISTDTVPRAPVNGLQIVPVAPPPPMPTLTVASGVATFAGGTVPVGCAITLSYPWPGVNSGTTPDILITNTGGTLNTLTGYIGPGMVISHGYLSPNAVNIELCNFGTAPATVSAATWPYKVIR